MYLLRQQNHVNLSEIGKMLGNRDHSTVIHGCEKITAAISTDSQLSTSIEDIRLLLKSHTAN
jgi:chromosomal replication initiator protein